jgi:hypothetical protein
MALLLGQRDHQLLVGRVVFRRQDPKGRLRAEGAPPGAAIRLTRRRGSRVERGKDRVEEI